ncbi:MAG: hypothetical protein KDA92_11445 [Planctomycetales bacterium]|nr:hypothetical protein [Planctomycetales bacterium]MCA9170234.1 hypothetical protein [Planctomycetales bacterium]
MNWQTPVALIIVAIAAGYVFRQALRAVTQSGRNCHGCTGSPQQGLKAKQLLSIELPCREDSEPAERGAK